MLTPSKGNTQAPQPELGVMLGVSLVWTGILQGAICIFSVVLQQLFSRAKGAALGGLEAHLLCLGREVAPAAADLAGLMEHGGGGGSRWSGALKRV